MTIMLLTAYLMLSAAGFTLSWINLRHLKRHGTEIPFGFEGFIDAATLCKTSTYTLEQNRIGLIESAVDSFILVLFLFAGGLYYYDRWILSVADSLIPCGILFFLPLLLFQTVLDIPFSLYRNFYLERRYGFNTMTPRLWLTDLIKSTILGIVLTSLVLAGALTLVRFSPQLWWLWVWCFFAVVSLLLMYLSPYVIEPLFYKFEPVRGEGMEEEIRSLMDRAGLKVSRVLQMDASRRSRHSNAYFTGIGRVKRIVLFDTLLEKLDQHEILAVLAHEAGHWKKRHLLKRLLFAELQALAACYATFLLLKWDGLPSLLGMETASFPAQLVIAGFLFSLIAALFTPLGSWLSRRHEWEADRFAVRLCGMPGALASALVKMSRDNLSNLHPAPIYAAFYYSHPPMAERVAKLLAQAADSADGIMRSTDTELQSK
jgi:STE24 endopeptidase